MSDHKDDTTTLETESTVKDQEDVSCSIPTAPDGGYGWVVALSGTMIITLKASFFAVFGVVYVDLVEHYDTSKTVISWVAATQQLLMGLSGLLYGPLIRKFSVRQVGFLTPLLVCLGYFTTALCKHAALLFVTYSLFIGIGLGGYEAVALPAVVNWFSKKRTLVLSINLIGYSLGAFIWPPLVTWLVEEYSWKGAFIIVAGAQIQTMVFFALLRPVDFVKRKKETLLDHSITTECPRTKCSAQSHNSESSDKDKSEKKNFCGWLFLFQNPSFSLLFLGMFFLYTGHIIPLGYTTIRGLLLGHCKAQSALLSSLLGIGNLLGRITAGLLACAVPPTKHIHLCCLSTMLTGFISILSMASDAYWFLATTSFIIGLISGFYVVFSFSGPVEMFDITYSAEIIGSIIAVSGIAFFVSNISAGVLLDWQNNPSLLFGVFGGAQCLAAFLFFFLLCLKRH